MIYINKNTQFVLTINDKSMFCPTQQVVIAIDKVKPLCKNDRTGSGFDDIRETLGRERERVILEGRYSPTFPP